MKGKKMLAIAVTAASILFFTASMSYAASGASLFANESCVGCHTINGTGGSVGPNLSHEGSKRSLAWIKKQITDPTSHFAPGSMDGSSAAIMPATSMSKSDLNALAGYIESLK
jgi:mono/diheme cytochrome c family protein